MPGPAPAMQESSGLDSWRWAQKCRITPGLGQPESLQKMEDRARAALILICERQRCVVRHQRLKGWQGDGRKGFTPLKLKQRQPGRVALSGSRSGRLTEGRHLSGNCVSSAVTQALRSRDANNYTNDRAGALAYFAALQAEEETCGAVA